MCKPLEMETDLVCLVNVFLEFLMCMCAYGLVIVGVRIGIDSKHTCIYANLRTSSECSLRSRTHEYKIWSKGYCLRMLGMNGRVTVMPRCCTR